MLCNRKISYNISVDQRYTHSTFIFNFKNNFRYKHYALYLNTRKVLKLIYFYQIYLLPKDIRSSLNYKKNL